MSANLWFAVCLYLVSGSTVAPIIRLPRTPSSTFTLSSVDVCVFARGASEEEGCSTVFLVSLPIESFCASLERLQRGLRTTEAAGPGGRRRCGGGLGTTEPADDLTFTLPFSSRVKYV